MKCRDMNPGNFSTGAIYGTDEYALNEVPGYESRQLSFSIFLYSKLIPSMKCRDMNPGNDRYHGYLPDEFEPSMKCRDMNPGNPSACW